MAGKVNNNLCLKDDLFGHGKILVGELFELWGVGELWRETGSLSSDDNWTGRRGMSMLEDAVISLMPDFEPHFRVHNQAVKADTVGEWAKNRAIECVRKNELDRFRVDDWSPSYNMVLRAIRDQKPITVNDIRQAQLEVIEAQYSGKSGVYIMTNVLDHSHVRIGQSEASLPDRYNNHRPYWEIHRVFATAPGLSRMLEGSFHDHIEGWGAKRFASGCNSFYVLPGSKTVDDWLEAAQLSYCRFFRNISRPLLEPSYA